MLQKPKNKSHKFRECNFLVCHQLYVALVLYTLDCEEVFYKDLPFISIEGRGSSAY